MAIELDKARAAGYSDAEILKGYSESKKFDLDGARAAGYTDKEILDRLAVPPAPAAAPEGDAGIWQGIKRTLPGLDTVRAMNAPTGSKILDALPFVNVAANLAKGVVSGAADQFNKAKESFQQGEYVNSFGHGLAAALPMIGPAAAEAGDKFQDGKPMEGIGQTIGILSQSMMPHVAPPIASGVSKILPGVRSAVIQRLASSSPRPLSSEAAAMAEKLKIPLSVGDRSGSKYAQGVEKIMGATIAPDLAEAHAAAAAVGIQRGIGDLTGDFATDHFAAGDHAIQGLVTHSKAAQQSAGGSYDELARAEAHPDNIVSVQQGVKKVPVPAGSVLDASGNPSPAGFREVPIMENIGLPVDTSAAKTLLSPIARTMKNQYPLARQQSDAGFHAVQNILNGPRYVPASVAENFLSAAKKLQRESTGPVKLLSGQAIDAMSPLVDDAVGRAGQTAVDTLHDGRAAWKEHMGTEDLLQSLAGDTTGKTGQTEAAARLLRPADASYPMLQQILAKTPEAADPLRGAILSRVFRKAETGEFTNPTQAANLFNQIGKRTQAALFSPAQLGDVKATLELAKRLAENPNPSGTGSLNAMMKMGLLVLHPVSGVTTLVLGRNFAKALYNPEGAMALRAALTGGKAAPAALATLEKAIAPAAEAAPPAAASDIQAFEGGGRVGVTDAEAPPEGTAFAPATVNPHEAPASIPASEGRAPSGVDPRGISEGASVRISPAAVAPTAPGAASKTDILVPGGNTYGGRYEVKELGDIQPSHHGATFEANPQFGLKNDRDYKNAVNQGKIISGSGEKFDPRYHVTDNPDASNGPAVLDDKGNVLGGNGRTMMLQRVFQSNTKGAASYRSLLDERAAQFGIDPASYAHMKQPVLTRVLDDAHLTPEAKQAAITDFNKTGTASLTPAERAIADSRRVSTDTLEHVGSKLEAKGPDATLAQVLDGQSGNQVLQKLIDDGVVSPQERAAFQNETGLTPAGKDRISQLMLGRFFRDPAQLDRISPLIRNKLERVAAPLAKAEGHAGWGLTEHVQEAMDLLEGAQAAGAKNLKDFIHQDGLFGTQKYSPEAVQIAVHLKDMKTDALVKNLRQYASDAKHADGGASMFGDPPTPKQSFHDALGEWRH